MIVKKGKYILMGIFISVLVAELLLMTGILIYLNITNSPFHYLYVTYLLMPLVVFAFLLLDKASVPWALGLFMTFGGLFLFFLGLTLELVLIYENNKLFNLESYIVLPVVFLGVIYITGVLILVSSRNVKDYINKELTNSIQTKLWMSPANPETGKKVIMITLLAVLSCEGIKYSLIFLVREMELYIVCQFIFFALPVLLLFIFLLVGKNWAKYILAICLIFSGFTLWCLEIVSGVANIMLKGNDNMFLTVPISVFIAIYLSGGLIILRSHHIEAYIYQKASIHSVAK